MGGAVNGGKMYGTFPTLTLALAGPDDSGSNGRWVPSTASSQYAATLAQWFGVPANQLGTVFPYIGNFGVNNLRIDHARCFPQGGCAASRLTARPVLTEHQLD
jgi:hypothetical protein